MKREDGARGAARHENSAPRVGFRAPGGRSDRKEEMPGGYFAYAASRRADVSAKNPGKPAPELAKIMGAEWRKLSESEKAKWTAQAKAGGSKTGSKGAGEKGKPGKKCK